ncbi:MAG: c-type cytochrome [Proteobacteria bacterium]|nr:c-type cytochrome [Pseudomonadota bacterium]
MRRRRRTYPVECPTAASAAETCSVDRETYFGWRTYAANCQVCHGGSELGSTFAPNLLERFNGKVDHARFLHVLENGRRHRAWWVPCPSGNPSAT